MDGATIEIAKKEDLEEVYRLRYKCLYKGDFDEKYVNEKTSEYIDEYDSDKAINIIAKQGNDDIVGATRLLFKSDSGLPYEWCYDYDFMAQYLFTTKDDVYKRCGLISRGCVHESYRTKGLYWKMLDFTKQFMLERGKDVLFATWLAANQGFANAHLRHDNWVFPDKQYLNSKRKPYYFGFKVLK